MIVKKKKICPIEVKSSGYTSHKSFDYLIKKYQLKSEDRYIIYYEGFEISRWNYLHSTLYDNVIIRCGTMIIGQINGITKTICPGS